MLGTGDVNLRVLEEVLDADIHVRGNRITLAGSVADVATADRVVAELDVVGRGTPLTPDTVRRSVAMLADPTAESPAQVLSLDIISRRGKTIRPRR